MRKLSTLMSREASSTLDISKIAKDYCILSWHEIIGVRLLVSFRKLSKRNLATILIISVSVKSRFNGILLNYILRIFAV